MDVYGIVYLLIDGSNDDEYVGQTTKTFEERFNEHKCGNQYIDRVIRKRGVDMFATAILKVCYSREELDYWERRLIKSRNTMAPNGYNLTEGGEGGSPCEETIEKIRDSINAYYEEHPEARDRISEEQKRRFSDPVERRKAAERTRKVFENPEIAAKHAESQRRRFEDPAERQKVADGVSAHFSKPGEREAQSERIKAYFDTPGARERNGESQSKRFEDPAERKKVSDGLKKFFAENGTRKQSAETREKMSVKRKAYWQRVRIAKLLPTIAAENLSAAKLPAEVSDDLKKFHAENPDAVTKSYELRKKSHAARIEKRNKQSVAQKARRERERIAKMPAMVAQQNLSAANLPAKIALS